MSIVIRVVLIAGLLVTVVGAEYGQVCTETTLRGAYAFTVHGSMIEDPTAPAVPYSSIAIATFDYYGNDRTQGTMNTPDGLFQVTANGAAEMAPDCTFVETYDIEIAGTPPMENQQARCAVLRRGAEINCASLNVGNSYRAHGKRMKTPGRCKERMLRGSFSFVCTGAVPNPMGGPMLLGNGTGIMRYDRKGDYSGSVTSNYGIAVVPRSFDGQIKVNPDCTTSWSQLDDQGGVMSGVGIVVNPNEIISLVDGAGAVSCVAKRIWAHGPRF